MIASVFFDTNVLVYAAVGTGKDEFKRERALELIGSEDFGTSAQVLQEFFVTVVKKAARPLSAVKALEWMNSWRHFHVKPLITSLCGSRSSNQSDSRFPTGTQRSLRRLKRLEPVLSTPKT